MELYADSRASIQLVCCNCPARVLWPTSCVCSSSLSCVLWPFLRLALGSCILVSGLVPPTSCTEPVFCNCESSVHSLSSSSGEHGLSVSPSKMSSTPISIPQFFVCPISMELMKDPVTTTTGQTFDRASIESWFCAGHKTCPTTNVKLTSKELIPNMTLRKLIHDWCAANYLQGLPLMPVTSKEPIDPSEVMQMLEDITTSVTAERYTALQRLRGLARESVRNRQIIVGLGAVPVLASLVATRRSTESSCASLPAVNEMDACEVDALELLAICPNNKDLFTSLGTPTGLQSLCWYLSNASVGVRVHAAVVFKRLLCHENGRKAGIPSTKGGVDGIVRLLKLLQGRNFHNYYVRDLGIKVGLKALWELVQIRANRDRAVILGIVPVLLGTLPVVTGHITKNLERTLGAIELFCKTSEGRAAAAAEQSIFVPTLLSILLRVSPAATDLSVSILKYICCCTPSIVANVVCHRASSLDAVKQLLLVHCTNCSVETKTNVRELLKALRRIAGKPTHELEWSSGITTLH